MTLKRPLDPYPLTLTLMVIGIAVGENPILDCPSVCFCDKKNVDSLPGGQGLKINCFPTLENPGTFDIRLPPNTVQLDLAKYGIRQIKSDTFADLLHLQKLDLQGNKIQMIADDSFRHLPKLEILDLSRNSLKILSKESLSGLAGLKRLRLGNNLIQTLSEKSFDDLKSIEKVDISENPLVCDCQIKWLADWYSSQPSRLINADQVKCVLPINVADKSLKEAISRGAFTDCQDNTKADTPKPQVFGKINLSPSHAQVVFEGDHLSFHCQSLEWLGTPQWLVNGNILSSESEFIQITSAIGHSVLSISKLESAFKGQVTCQVLGGPSMSVDIYVLPQRTPVCLPITLETSRGEYHWGAALGGTTLHQTCKRKVDQPNAKASLDCHKTGEWGAVVNVSECAYTSQVTDTLHKFATMNPDFTMSTLRESAKYFLNYTAEPRTFQNPMDIVYFSQAVENYLPYLPQSNEVGHYMMDMVANVLGVDRDLMSDAQKHGLACRRLLKVMENITAIAVPAFKHDNDLTLAMEAFFVKPMQRFEGVSCSWYESQDYLPRRVFHCVQNNHTIQSNDKIQMASVRLPASIYHQILISYNSVQLMFAAFDNSSLFPSDLKTSQVIGCRLLGSKQNLNLSDPIIGSIMMDPIMEEFYDIIPVFWDQYSNGGFGAWTSGPCSLKDISKGQAEFTCSKLGYYSLRYDLKGPQGLPQESKWHSPVLYTGGGLAILLVLINLTCFGCKFRILKMTKEFCHTLLNLWFTSLIMLYIYLMGIYQVGHSEAACRIVAFILHHLLISSLFWILIGVFVIYAKVSKKKNPGMEGFLVRGQECKQESPASKDEDLRPLLMKFYFCAYGIPLIIVAVTASTSINNYNSPNFCFLTSKIPLIGGLVVPSVLLLTVMIGFSLSILCVLAASPYKVTEAEETNDMKKKLAMLDTIQSPRHHLFSLIVQAFFLVLTFILAGIQLNFPGILTSLAVSISAISFGLYIFVTFCLLRADIFGMLSKKPSTYDGSPTHEDLAANFVELCPRPLPPTANSSERTSSLRPPTNFNMMPKTSSPANSQIPFEQEPTISPLVLNHEDPRTEPYSIVPVAYKQPEMSLASVKTGFSYTDSSTIKMTGGCDLATFDMGQPSSASLIGSGTPKRLLNFGPHSASLPRSLKNNHDLETQSKFSMASSRSGHSRSSGRKRHKKPNRRRPRPGKKDAKEPVYNNVEEEYHGDDDQFDTLERNRRTIALPDELPSVIHEIEDDEEEDDQDRELELEDDLSQGRREEPASLEDLPPVDLPKRETSV